MERSSAVRRSGAESRLRPRLQRALLYAGTAFVVARLIQGPPRHFGMLGGMDPWPLAIVAAISALLAALVVPRAAPAMALQRPVRTVLAGTVSTVLVAHLLFGRGAFLAGALTGAGRPVHLAEAAVLSLASSVYSLLFCYVTLPLAILAEFVDAGLRKMRLSRRRPPSPR